MSRSSVSSRCRRARACAVAVFVTLVVLPGSVAAAPCWLPPVVGLVAEPYRQPACRWCPGHRGIAYDTEPGTPVRAVAAGTVTFAGTIVGVRYVVVEHANGWRATYGELADTLVERGDTVVARSIVGIAGETTHFGLREGPSYLDPTPYLGRLVTTPRLVPLDGSAGGPSGPPTLRCATPPSWPETGANPEDRR
jgi:murein DD-endopeptidase MepM/ murein hydrolase activator NlpD